MPTTKLTLSIPEQLVQEAKVYSKKTHQSLSSLVSRYFALMARSLKGAPLEKNSSSKLVKATGLVKSSKSEEDLIFDALTEKYLR